MWISSPAHYENIVGEHYSRMWYAFVRGERGQIYACQLFASDEPIDFMDEPIMS